MSDNNDSDSEQDESQGSSSDGVGHRLFDLEASEDDSEKGINLDDEFDSDNNDDDYPEPFPMFMQLPAELREMIWQAFCPDLTAGSRVFEVLTMAPGPSGLVPGPCLEDQTSPMRTLLAIHEETRAMGLRSSPHLFTLSGGEHIRYHEERDVIHIGIPPNFDETEVFLGIQELGGSPRNIAIPYDFTDTYFADLCYLLPDVRKAFILFDDLDMGELSTKHHAWVVSDNVHHYYTETQEDGEAGLVATVKRLFCWPDIDNHRDFASHKINYSDTGGSLFEDKIRACRDWLADPLLYSDVLAEDDLADEEKAEAAARLQSIEVWPMIRFNYDSGLQTFTHMKAWDQPWDEYDSGSSASDDPEDEYESEGIDDGTVDGYPSTDDEDDFPIDQSSDQDAPGQLLGSSSTVNNHLAAQFSSDDDEPNNQRSDAEASEPDGEDGDGGEEGSRGRASSRPKRRRVVESGSEGESSSATETEEPPRPAANRRARTVLADSEDEADGDGAVPRPAQGRKRRSRAVPTDSEGEDEDELPQPPRAQNRRARAIPNDSDDGDDDDDDGGGGGESDAQKGGTGPQTSDSSQEEGEHSSDEEDEEEEDEPAPARRLSLAKRLRMEAQRARPGKLGGDDSDADAQDYGAAPDDDEEDGDGASDHDGTSVEEEEEDDDDDGDGGESEEEY